MFAAIGLPEVMAALMLVGLNAYVLLGGADYGGGVWDLLASGHRRDRQRALIADAIGPIWEANHVWLILVVVLLFTCFPPAFATIVTELHIPLTLMLVGVVLRGSAFTFRTYDSQQDDVQARWGLVFSLSSIFTPAMLGIVVGALATGGVGRASQLSNASFTERFVAPWLNPFVLGVGVLALVLFAFLAAVYLTVEARGDIGLQRDFRRRALGAGFGVFVCAGGTLALAGRWAPHLQDVVMRSPTAIPLQIATAIAALVALAALTIRRYRLARFAAAAQVSLILWGWVMADYPYLVPPTLTIRDAAAPAVTLRLTLIALGAGAVLLVPSLLYLFRVFKSRPLAFEGLHEELRTREHPSSSTREESV
jgi:cytochrome bd ubiquinol oxidase subunit II